MKQTREEYIKELEDQRNEATKESNYYRIELAKAHTILGRVVHQLAERWDNVNLTSYHPTDNLGKNRKVGNIGDINKEII